MKFKEEGKNCCKFGYYAFECRSSIQDLEENANFVEKRRQKYNLLCLWYSKP